MTFNVMTVSVIKCYKHNVVCMKKIKKELSSQYFSLLCKCLLIDDDLYMNKIQLMSCNYEFLFHCRDTILYTKS